MIGDGPLMGKVRQVLEARNIGNSVELFGFLDGDEKIEVFLNSKIFAHPAIYDTGGLAPMEAMGLGVPAISYDLTGLKEVYPKGMHKVDNYDTKKFAQDILAMLSNKERYEDLSQQAVELSSDWNWNNHATTMLDRFYELSKNGETKLAR